MTESSFGIRGISPFAGTLQRRRQPQDREGERSLAKHADVTDADNDAQGANNEATQESLSLDPGRLIDIRV